MKKYFFLPVKCIISRQTLIEFVIIGLSTALDHGLLIHVSSPIKTKGAHSQASTGSAPLPLKIAMNPFMKNSTVAGPIIIYNIWEC